MSDQHSGQVGRKPGAMPFQKYRPFEQIDLPDRQWPGNRIERAPRWCSVDLRDGNQALIDPMDVGEKLRLFETLLEIGFREIEVGFPAASQPDFDFIRMIIDRGLVPDGVTIQVLCQARKELIDRTVEALEGSKQAIFHLYNSTSALQRDVVFGMSRDEIKAMAVQGCEWVKEAVARIPDTQVTLEYSPESFTGTELDFAVEVCTAVADCWGPTPADPIIINLPSTVEMATPNIYADQIEWFIRHFPARDSAVISLHTHNDRGTGIAATEMAIMAGAERVEGTLFGNGERTGNCDLVTMAMNLFSQGVDPQLDLRDMPHIREVAEAVTKLPVHQRHPYAGELVFTAFSGSHQDAIRKGMTRVRGEQKQVGGENEPRWQVPYLPIDPSDVGSSYRETVRVNSQSGKGGVGFIMESYHGINLPREVLVEFSGIVQGLTEELGREVTADEIYDAFVKAYLRTDGACALREYQLSQVGDTQHCAAKIMVDGREVDAHGTGTGPIDAFVNALSGALDQPITVVVFNEQSMDTGEDAQAVCLIAIDSGNGGRVYGAGMSRNTNTASLEAVVAAVNRRAEA